MTSRQVLCEGHAKGTRLEEIFYQKKVNDKIFLDRDGKTF